MKRKGTLYFCVFVFWCKFTYPLEAIQIAFDNVVCQTIVQIFNKQNLVYRLVEWRVSRVLRFRI